MKFTVLSATPKQRENIAFLIQYLTERLRAKDATYDHGNIAACTIGFAIKSRLFSPLNTYSIVDDMGDPMVVRTKGSQKNPVPVQERTMRDLFGEDYVSNIVFQGRVPRNTFQPFKSSPTHSLRYVIAYLTKAYQIEAAPPLETQAPQMDNLREEVTARVAELEEVVKACEVLYKHSPLQSVKQVKETAETELYILKNLLTK